MNNWGLLTALMIIVITTVAIVTINYGGETDVYEFPAELSLVTDQGAAGHKETLSNSF